jgi:ABC-type branched-subunit amino acid transport system ATPase component
VLAIADRAVLLRQGRTTFSGTAAELAERPDLVEAGYLGDAS